MYLPWFEKKIDMTSRRAMADVEHDLMVLAQPSVFGGGGKIFVGRVRGGVGRLWFYISPASPIPARSLKFRLVPMDVGCRLVGSLSLIVPLRLFAGSYFLFCVLFPLWIMIHAIARYAFQALHVVEFLGPVLFGAVFFVGYCGMAVRLGRRQENLGLKMIRHTIADETSAALIADLASVG